MPESTDRVKFEAVRHLVGRRAFGAIVQVLGEDPYGEFRRRYFLWRTRYERKRRVIMLRSEPARGATGIRSLYCRTFFREEQHLPVPYVALISVTGGRYRQASALFLVFRTRDEAGDFLGDVPVRWWEPEELLEFLRGHPFRIRVNEPVISEELERRGFPPNPWYSRAYALSRLSALPPKISHLASAAHDRWADFRDMDRKRFPYFPPQYVPAPDLPEADLEWPLGVSGNWYDLYRYRNVGGVWRIWEYTLVRSGGSRRFVLIPYYVHPSPPPGRAKARQVHPRRMFRWFLFEILIWAWSDPRPFVMCGIQNRMREREDLRRVRRALEDLPLRSGGSDPLSLSESLARIAMACADYMSGLWRKHGPSAPEALDVLPSTHGDEWHRQAKWMVSRMLRHDSARPQGILEALARDIGPSARWRWEIRKRAIRRRERSGLRTERHGDRVPVPDFRHVARVRKSPGSGRTRG